MLPPLKFLAINIVLPCATFCVVSSLVPSAESESSLACDEKIIDILTNLLLWTILTSVTRLCLDTILFRAVAANKSLLGYFLHTLSSSELHMPGHNFTGPGTDLSKRLQPDLTWKKGCEPVNLVDEAAYAHDVAYFKANTSISREAADLDLIDSMESILDSNCVSTREITEAWIVKVLMCIKCILRQL